MEQPVVAVLTLLVLLQVKHLVADFVLQNAYILENRRIYGHPGGLLHVGVHALLSAVAFLVMGTPVAVLAAMLVAEAVFHYHLDWAKDNFTHARALGPGQSLFWIALGADQALHQLSYLALALWWMHAAGGV
jgi:hypothetical protein